MTSTTWLLFILSLPGRSGGPRMRAWRALKAGGAGILRDGVYLLPGSPAADATFREVAGTVEEAGGNAYLLECPVRDGSQDRDFRALFDRSADYAGWLDRVAALRDGLVGLDEPEARRQHAQLGRELETLVAIDFFPGEAHDRARQALQAMGGALDARFSPGEPTARRGGLARCSRRDFSGRTWATRAHLWVDRVASAWLIRRFIDPGAAFLWLDDPDRCPGDAVGFDFDGATFSHVGDRVTFESLLESFDLGADAALAKIGAMVHYLDVGGVPVAEAAGFVTLLGGVRRRCADDDEFLAATSTLLDDLHAAFAAEPEPRN